MSNVKDWATTAAGNAVAFDDIDGRDGQSRPQGKINNRAIMAAVRRMYDTVAPNVRLFDVRAYGAVSDAVVTTSGTVTTGTDCKTAVTNAIAAAVAAGVSASNPMGILFQGGAFYTTETVPLVSGLRFVGVDGALYVQVATPTGSRGHHRTAAISMVGTQPDADWTAIPGSGEYFVDAPVAFAATSTFNAGSTAITAAATPSASIVDGTWLHISGGWAFWHPLVSELVQVSSVVGNVINLRTPLRYSYDNLTTGLAATVKTYVRTANDSHGVNYDSWPVSGYRRVVPCVNAGVSCNNFTVQVINSPAGYQAFSLFAFCAVGGVIDGLKSQGGSVWLMDCQDFVFNTPKFGPNYAATSVVGSLLVNGSNNVVFNSPTGTKFIPNIEEGASDIAFNNVTLNDCFFFAQAGAKNITINGGAITCGSASAVQVGGSSYNAPGVLNFNMRNVVATGTGSGFVSYSKSAITTLAAIPAANLAAIAPYYRGEQVSVRDCIIRAPGSPGAELVTEQRIRLDNVRIGINASAGIFGTATTAIGTLFRDFDGERVGQLSAAALPTFPAAFAGEYALNTTGGAGWTATRIKAATVTSNPTTTTLVVTPYVAATDYAVGDVVQVLCSNGTTNLASVGTTTAGNATITAIASTAGVANGQAISGFGIQIGATVSSFTANSITMSLPALYSNTSSPFTVGSALLEHTAVITVVNLGTTTITIGTAIPAGYTAVTTTGGYLRATRWT